MYAGAPSSSTTSTITQRQGARSIAGAVVAHAFRIGTQMVRSSVAQHADQTFAQHGATDPVALSCSDIEHCLNQITPFTASICDDANRRALVGARVVAKHVVQSANDYAQQVQQAQQEQLEHNSFQTPRKPSALRQAIASTMLVTAKAAAKALDDFDLDEVQRQAACKADRDAAMRRAVMLECERISSMPNFSGRQRLVKKNCCQLTWLSLKSKVLAVRRFFMNK
jgi:hypothetical protein